MKIALIDCLSIGDGQRRFSRDFIGGGPKQIAGILSMKFKNQITCKIFRAEELLFSTSLDKQIGNFEICMISAMSMDKIGVKRIVSIWRSVHGNGLIIIGGPISNNPSLIEILDIDISIIGEAERQIIDLFELLLKNNLGTLSKDILNHLLEIQGISFIWQGKTFTSPPAPRLNKKDYNFFSQPGYIIPYISHYPNYHGARIYVECLRGCSNYHRTTFPIKNTKGCIPECNRCRKGDLSGRINCPAYIPPGCGFCSTINSFGYPKSRKASHIFSEIQGIIGMGGKRIVLGGPDFLDYERENLIKNKELTEPKFPPHPNYEALEQLISKLRSIPEIKQKKVQIFIENVKASLCTNKVLDIIAKIPRAILSIGCETGSEIFSRELGRPNGPREVLKAVRKCLRHNIRVHVYFIHHLPGEKPEYLRESIGLIKQFYNMGVEKITNYRYHNFPGAPFYDLNEKQIYRNNKKLNKLRKKLVKTVINFNKQRKFEMLGKKYTAIAAEKSKYNKKDVIAYIIQGGPKILLKDFSGQMENIYEIKISGVISDKLVEGEIV